jgi:hypothetical protein
MFVFHPFTMATALGTAGDNLALGTARPGHRSFADAGYADGDKVIYHLLYGTDWEVGVGYLDDDAATLVRYDSHVLEPTAGTLLDVVEDEECIVSVEAPAALGGFRGLIIKKTGWSYSRYLTDIPFDTVVIDTDGLYTGGGSDQTQFDIPDWCEHAQATLYLTETIGYNKSINVTYRIEAQGDGSSTKIWTSAKYKSALDYNPVTMSMQLRSPLLWFDPTAATRCFKGQINDSVSDSETIDALFKIELIG